MTKYDLWKGCLCWFWNNKETDIRIGILADYFQDEEYPEMLTFYELNGGCYKHCEPAKYKDVLFVNENPMKQVYLSAKEKAERKIIEAIETYFKEVKPDYINELPNYIEGMRKNNEHIACGESELVTKAIEKYMEEAI